MKTMPIPNIPSTTPFARQELDLKPGDKLLCVTSAVYSMVHKGKVYTVKSIDGGHIYLEEIPDVAYFDFQFHKVVE